MSKCNPSVILGRKEDQCYEGKKSEHTVLEWKWKEPDDVPKNKEKDAKMRSYKFVVDRDTENCSIPVST